MKRVIDTLHFLLLAIFFKAFFLKKFIVRFLVAHLDMTLNITLAPPFTKDTRGVVVKIPAR